MPRDIAILDMDNHAVQRMVKETIRNATGLCWFVCRKARNQRSLRQNAYLWGVVYPLVAFGLKEAWGEESDADSAHEFCKGRFLARDVFNHKTGELEGHIARSTTDLDTAECTDYIEKIRDFAARELSIEIPEPTTNHQEQKCHRSIA